MARPLRIEFAGATYHVMSRGNEKSPIVHDDTDRCKRLEWLRRAVETYSWRLHAFVLMNNHEHLFVTTPEANLSAGMQYLNGSYASYFNRRHGRVGHLLQGRFKGLIVDTGKYTIQLSRYIHLNPYEARLVSKPESYPWGSYPGYYWKHKALPWVSYDHVLGEFGCRANDARREYRAFIAAGMTQPLVPPWEAAVENLILGSEAFVERIRSLIRERPPEASVPQLQRLRDRPALSQIRAAVAMEFQSDQDRWLPGRRNDDMSRAVAAFVARRLFGHSIIAIAAELGFKNPSSVTSSIRRVDSTGDKDLLSTIERVAQRSRSEPFGRA